MLTYFLVFLAGMAFLGISAMAFVVWAIGSGRWRIR